jgi:hypothetical protein
MGRSVLGDLLVDWKVVQCWVMLNPTLNDLFSAFMIKYDKPSLVSTSINKFI